MLFRSQIINCMASPMISDSCNSGMDHQKRQELIAYRCDNNPELIAEEIGADKVFYPSLKGLNDIVKETYHTGICAGCFGGKYPIKK